MDVSCEQIVNKTSGRNKQHVNAAKYHQCFLAQIAFAVTKCPEILYM